ncbi:MAG: hypothetical protein A2X86_03915 [Bdellovibrionales bacterium GWA2_49_15]|nr:MAG: hypothetical protein A2X86_03915 [Bdellovibrionales bacterium GWA2_49_15]HAZ12363.1 hypothetical protein [Bdellovibrionales bacterium]
MAATDKRAQIIIKKKIMGGHAGHHGGAWKVAYADFITAMMAFFMVLWLMGADEETKLNIQTYFSEGATPGGADTINKNGAYGGGDSSMRSDGAQGRLSEEWVKRPTTTAPVYIEEQETLHNLQRNFEGTAFSTDTSNDAKVMFKVPGEIKFPVSSHTVPTEAYEYLRSISGALREHDGTVVIEGRGDKPEDWSLAFVRATAVRNILIKDYAINPDKLIPTAAYDLGGNGRVIASGEVKRGQITFVLKRTREP